MPSVSPGATFSELVEVMRRLLAPEGGCPWDREQTLATLAPYLLEETYELLEAMADPDPAHHREELGDLLFQVVFQAALREREGAFDIDDVARGIVDKLVRRHPHVFADAKVSDSAEVLANWAEIKKQEKGRRRTLEGVPAALPALARAQKLGDRAAAVGFDWPDLAGPRDKLAEELAELEAATQAGDQAAIAHELGDVLFSVVNLARKLGVDAEGALRATTTRFEQRFGHVEDALAAAGRSPRESTLAEMDRLWDEAKTAAAGGVAGAASRHVASDDDQK